MLVILQNIFTENFQHLIFNVISKNKVLLKFGSFWEIFSWIINHIYIFRPSARFNLIIYFMGFNYQNKSSQIRNSSWNYSISSCEAKYRRNKKDPKTLTCHRNNRLDSRIFKITFVIIHYNQQTITKVFNRTNCVTTRGMPQLNTIEECKIWGLTRKIRDKRPSVRSTTDIFLQGASGFFRVYFSSFTRRTGQLDGGHLIIEFELLLW